jgi:hypothetical protein
MLFLRLWPSDTNMWFYEHEICISLLHCALVNFVVFVSLSQPSVWYKNHFNYFVWQSLPVSGWNCVQTTTGFSLIRGLCCYRIHILWYAQNTVTLAKICYRNIIIYVQITSSCVPLIEHFLLRISDLLFWPKPLETFEAVTALSTSRTY